MATYIILSRFTQNAFDTEDDLRTYSQTVRDRIREECPGVQWQQSFATTGSIDAVDIVEADDLKQVQKASLIIRAMGYAHTETMEASSWDEFINAL